MLEDEYIDTVKRNNHRLFLIAFSYVQNQSDAEDIMQNTFLKLWKYSGSFNDIEHIDKWLTRVCVNECKDFHRLSIRRNTSLDEAVEMAKNDMLFDIDLFKAVSSLPKKERMVVHLFYYEEFTISEISSLTKIKESTVKSILHRSRKKLKTMLGDEWINEK